MASRATDAFHDEQAREWFSASELESFAVPALGDKRAINRRAQEERWTARTGAGGALLVRPRKGRGGGVEFHVSLLPPAARLELAKRGITGERPAPVAANSDVGGWRWFDGQTDAVKAVAAHRLAIVSEVELLVSSAMTVTAAIADVGARQGVSPATIASWRAMVKGVAAKDRLPALAPHRKGGGAKAEIDPALWTIYKSDATRKSAPTLTSCYDRTAAIAAERGLSVPCERTFRRRLEAELDPRIFKLLREGEEAFRRSIPAERRTIDHLHAMEVVNIDGHKFDVRVIPQGGGKPIRPIMVAIQDVRSSKIVGWCLDEAETTASARLAIAHMIRDYGIPKRMTSDNGRAFTSKALSGGNKTRFRGKILDSDPTGLLVALGVDINWAIPGRGQSKPIERAFRDLADTISRGPECEGAYTGPNPMAKPDNYETRAVPWAEFHEIVARGVRRHNAKLGRTGRDYRGRSFDQVFADTFVEIGKATPEHLRMALLAAEQKRVNKQTGEVELYGNRYWDEQCGQLHGQMVTVRFDPDNLHSEVHLYDQQGRFLLTAQLIADSQWGDVAGAKATAKRVADARRKVREGAEAEQMLVAGELAALQADATPIALPEPAAIRPHRHRGQVAAQLKPAAAPRAAVAAERESRVFGALRLVGDE